MALLLFSKGILQQLILHRHFGIHLLEPPVFLGHRVGCACLRLISDSIAASIPPYLLRQL
jgi:hypothetical protein